MTTTMENPHAAGQAAINPIEAARRFLASVTYAEVYRTVDRRNMQNGIRSDGNTSGSPSDVEVRAALEGVQRMLAIVDASARPTATPSAMVYAEAQQIYTRLCAKARRVFHRADDPSAALCAIVQAMSNPWDWNQAQCVSDLKHLAEDDRADVLRLIGFITGKSGLPASFDSIHREAFASL